MQTNSPAIRSLTLFLGLLGAIPSAFATTTLEYDLLAAARDDNGSYTYDSFGYNAALSQPPGPVTSAGGQTYSFGAQVDGTSTAYASTNLAHNHAFVSGSASVDYSSIRGSIYGGGRTDTGPSPFGTYRDNRFAALGHGTMSATVLDYLQIGSTTLPTGSAVQVAVDVYFHARVGMTGYPAGHLTTSVVAPYAELFFGGATRAVSAYDAQNYLPLAVNEDSFMDTYVFNTRVGAGVQLLSRLRLRGGLDTYSPIADVEGGPRTGLTTSGFSDASSTTLMAVRVLTPGADYVADSGTAYPTVIAVPEPGAVVLWFLGLVAICLRVRKAPKVASPHGHEPCTSPPSLRLLPAGRCVPL